VAGILLIRKDGKNVLRPVQIVINELSWFAVLVGAIAVVWSLLASRGCGLDYGQGRLVTAIGLEAIHGVSSDVGRCGFGYAGGTRQKL